LLVILLFPRAQFAKDNPTIATPAATDMAVVFFQGFSAENPGKFHEADG